MGEAYIIDAVRTPRGIGKPGKGALSHLHPQHLAATVLKAIKERNHLDTSTVDDIVWSTSSQVGKQGGDLGRMAALSAGYDVKASGTTLAPSRISDGTKFGFCVRSRVRSTMRYRTSPTARTPSHAHRRERSPMIGSFRTR